MAVALAAVLAFVGWLITGAGWFVSQRGQRKLFVHQIKNAARGELVSALRTEQGVMGTLHVTIVGINVGRLYEATSGQPQLKWNEVFERYQRIAAGSDTQWVFMLEQYAVLFPETVDCRLELVERSRRLNGEVTQFFVGLLYENNRTAVLETAQSLMSRLSDQEALLEDLLVHIQNATLGEVVGRKVPFRQPPDPTVPRIVLEKKQLRIVDGQRKSMGPRD